MTRRLESPEEAAARLAAEALTAREEALLWERIEASAATPAWRRRPALRGALIAAPALALALTALLLFVFRGQQDDAVSSPLPRAANDACALQSGDRQLRLPRSCAPAAVRVAGDEWLLGGGAEVARVPSGARVVQGRVRFRVRHRTRSQFSVQVSHGEVRVIGTVFQIEQEAARGSVSVSEGVIEFVWNDGTRERVAAGQTLHWPRPERVAGTPAPPADAGASPDEPGKSAAQATVDLERMTARLLQLQSQKRFGEAVVLLRKTLGGRGLTTLQRERISYELGLALEAGGEPSCAHWKRHVARFGAQRHADALSQRLKRCRGE